jgi:hypothetical protein
MEVVETWLSSLAEDFFDTSIQELIPRYKCLNSGGDYVEKKFRYVRIFCIKFFLISCFLTGHWRLLSELPSYIDPGTWLKSTFVNIKCRLL